jgi:AcrR family transcriptional regulator
MALDRDEISERVLEIAEALISDGGAVNLKARSIAERAGIAVGSIYNLFGDLDQVHGRVNMRLLDRLAEAGAVAIGEMNRQGVTDTRLRLFSLAKAYLGFVQRHPVSWAALLAFNPRKMAAEQQLAYESRLDTLFEIIAAVLAEDKTLKLDEARRRLTARVLWSSVHGIVTNGAGRRQQDRQGDGVWEQIDLLVTTFLKGIDRG